MMMARVVAPLSCAKLERIWKLATFKNPATIMWIYSPRGTFRLWPVLMAARNKVEAPIPEPATRRLQGDISRNATAAAIQLRPQAKASSTTSSLAVVSASRFVLEFCISWKSGGRACVFGWADHAIARAPLQGEAAL